MDWLRLLLALVQAFGSVVLYLRTKDLLDAGGAKVIADALKGQSDEIHRAQAAREKVRADAARDPAGVLRDDDGWKRK